MYRLYVTDKAEEMEIHVNLLIYKWDIFPYDDIIHTLKKQGHSINVLAFPIINHISDKAFEEKLEEELTCTAYDAVFSVNYFTVISNVCEKRHVTYLSWTCDSPLLSMHNQSIHNSVNRIYTFDKKEYLDFTSQGVDTIYYLPLAGNPKRELVTTKNADGSIQYLYDVSFVGNLYDKNRYDEMAHAFPDYLCGYMDAAIEAQLNVSGGSLLNTMLTDEIMNLIAPYVSLNEEISSTADIKLHFATSVLSHKAAALMRIQTLNQLSRIADVHLFTTSDTSPLIGVNIHPPVTYAEESPKVFASSKINLNMTVPNIENGIPLRVFDIMSCGGFVLTDYRPELEQLFDIGKDIAVYDGISDLKAKVLYYLSHDRERETIAYNGYKTLCKKHTYSKRLLEIMT